MLCHLPSSFPLTPSLDFCQGTCSGLTQGAEEVPYTHKFSDALAPELALEGLDELQYLKEMMGARRSRMAGLRPYRTAGHEVGLAAMPNRTLSGMVS